MLLCSGSIIPAGLAGFLSRSCPLLSASCSSRALGKALRSCRFVATLNLFLISNVSLFLCFNCFVLTLFAPSAPCVVSLVSPALSPGRRWVSRQHCLPIRLTLILALHYPCFSPSLQATIEHRAQIMLYCLLMAERYQQPIHAGLLMYLQGPTTVSEG